MKDATGDLKHIPLAIVGMACRLPGADDLHQFWEMLAQGRCAVADLPPERLDAALYFDPERGAPNKCYTRLGAIVTNCRFEDEVPISPQLAKRADATHWMMCQVAAQALRNAGMDPLKLPYRNAGVYIGHTIGSGLEGDLACAAGIGEASQLLYGVGPFRDLAADVQRTLVEEMTSSVRDQMVPHQDVDWDVSSNMVAGIITKAFGLEGPFMAVNAACASSLQSLLLAARSLQRGSIDMAIVGGASVCSRDWLLLFSSAQSLSSTQSRPFDHRADGLVIGEGYTAVILKTLDRAVADRDTVHAVIRGIGMSTDGRGRSLWAPRREGQVQAIRRAYRDNAELSEVQYIEAHATATPLGDATEIASVQEALQDAIPAGKKIPMGSVKANIGHLLEAAGLAGLIKAVLCMQRKTIPAAINVEQLNPSIDWAQVPVHVPRQSIAWPATEAGKPRRAGINAFGIGGLNMHVAISSYEVRADDDDDDERESPVARTPAVARERDDDAVAVVGAGCVFPGALSVPAFQALLSSSRDPKTPAPAERWFSVPCDGASDPTFTSQSPPRGGFVAQFVYDWRRHRIPPRQVEYADPLQFMMLDAADQALCDAGYDQKSFDRLRTGVVVGTEFTGDFTDRLQLVLRLPDLQQVLRRLLAARTITGGQSDAIVSAFGEALREKWPVLADETGSFSASSLAVRIAKTWDLMGGACAVDSGATSSLAALAAAIDLLICGDCDLTFCVGAQRNMNRRKYEMLARAGFLVQDASARGPFDRNASGYVPAEGGGVLLLKRLRDARRDGDRIRAVFHRVAVSHKNTVDALREAVVHSLEESGWRAGNLQLLMTDASGVRADDELVARAALATTDAAEGGTRLQLSSVVGQIGHAGGASGMASLVATILALEQRSAPLVAGLVDPLPILLREPTRVVCSTGRESPTNSTNTATIAAVVSHDKGMAWSAVCESAASAVIPATGEGTTVDVPATLPDKSVPAGATGAGIPPSATSWGDDTTSRVAHRSVLRLAEAPLSNGEIARFQPTGAVVVIGDNEIADAICRLVAGSRVPVHRFLPREGLQALLARMQNLPTDPPPRHVFVATGSDRTPFSATAATWPATRKRDMELPFLLLQKWGQLLVKQKVDGQLSLAATTRLGGDLGLSGPVPSPVGGWLGGVLKSLHVELKRRQHATVVKICDFSDRDQPRDVAETLLCELACGRSEVEVAMGGGRRRVVRVIAEPVESLPRRDLARGGVWVMTGGARGITAEVAKSLGRNYQLRLHLIGRSPVPQENAPWRRCSEEQLREIKRSIVRQAIADKKSPEQQWDRVKADIEIFDNLRRMSRLGLNVSYHSCDVSDWSALSRVLDQVRAQSGPIEGIIHGAGYARSSRFEMVKLERLQATIAAKVDGAVALMELTGQDPLRYFVGFGSISGRYGGNGLSDYAGANEMLVKLCARYRTLRPDCATSCIDWQSWDEVGMAMVPESTAGTRGILKLKFIPPPEGVAHLASELVAGLPEREVLIDDGEFARLI